MKLWLLIFLVPLCGCSTFNGGLAKVIHELARDTNTVVLEVTSPTFGTLKLHRNVPVKP